MLSGKKLLSNGHILYDCVLVAQSCLTLCDPMDWSPPRSSVHGILQARILEWVAISFSRYCMIIFHFCNFDILIISYSYCQDYLHKMIKMSKLQKRKINQWLPRTRHGGGTVMGAGGSSLWCWSGSAPCVQRWLHTSAHEKLTQGPLVCHAQCSGLTLCIRCNYWGKLSEEHQDLAAVFQISCESIVTSK